METTANTNRGKKFIRDLGIYAIGNIGSKLITFLLVPFYTFFITDPAAFGYYDICLTAVFILNPFISFDLPEGAFRFLLETGDLKRHRAIISYVARAMARNSVFVIAAALVLGTFCDIKYLAYITAFGIAQSAYDATLQIVRGLSHTRTFVVIGIFNAFAIAIFSVLTVAVLGWGVEGIFIANITARVASLLFAEYKIKIIRRYCRTRYLIKDITRELLRYSLPLLPMVLLWWVLNSNNIFFIKHFLGLRENGIFAVLSKFTSILFILATIFYQTWQQNAIEQYNSSDRNSFFSNVLNNYIYLLCFLIAVFPIAIRINFFWLVSSEYYESSRYLFANAFYVMTFAIAAFYELGYQCSKNTSRMIPSILIAAVLNVSCNYFLIPLWGLYGAIASNIICYIFLIVYRIFDTRKYMELTVTPKSLVAFVLMAIAGVYFYLSASVVTDIIFLVVITSLFVIALPPDIRHRLSSILSRH